jgi:hypothetical protein
MVPRLLSADGLPKTCGSYAAHNNGQPSLLLHHQNSSRYNCGNGTKVGSSGHHPINKGSFKGRHT